MDPFFSDHIWSLKAMTTDKRVLIPIYEMSAKEIKGYIKCFRRQDKFEKGVVANR